MIPKETLPEEPLLTPQQAARVLNTTERQVRSLCHRGSIPYVRLGQRLMRIRPTDLRSLVTAAFMPTEKAR
jgi:excisionase family DNA binding protein